VTIRAFVALELDEPTRDAFLRLQRDLEKTAPRGMRMVAAEALHVTLKFFGEIDPSIVSPLTSVLAPRATRVPSSARIAELSAFPRPTRALVAIASLEDATGGFKAMARSFDDLAEPHGIPRETRPFHPHITLARAKGPLDARAWLGSVRLPEAPARFSALVFFRSDHGAYTPLARWPLDD
jgi:2'-5' RNA ligase